MTTMLVANVGEAVPVLYASMLSVWYDRFEGWRAQNSAPLPHYRGSDRIAGDPPAGLVLFNGLPAARVVDLFHRDTGILVATTTSDASDGTYEFAGLDAAELFDVRFRGEDSLEADIFWSWITPEPP